MASNSERTGPSDDNPNLAEMDIKVVGSSVGTNPSQLLLTLQIDYAGMEKQKIAMEEKIKLLEAELRESKGKLEQTDSANHEFRKKLEEEKGLLLKEVEHERRLKEDNSSKCMDTIASLQKQIGTLTEEKIKFEDFFRGLVSVTKYSGDVSNPNCFKDFLDHIKVLVESARQREEVVDHLKTMLSNLGKGSEAFVATKAKNVEDHVALSANRNALSEDAQETEANQAVSQPMPVSEGVASNVMEIVDYQTLNKNDLMAIAISGESHAESFPLGHPGTITPPAFTSQVLTNGTSTTSKAVGRSAVKRKKSEHSRATKKAVIPKFNCPNCESRFFELRFLKRHLKDFHQMPDIFKDFVAGCSFCGMKFMKKGDVNRHRTSCSERMKLRQDDQTLAPQHPTQPTGLSSDAAANVEPALISTVTFPEIPNESVPTAEVMEESSTINT